MKNIFRILLLVLILASCDKAYEESYPSLYRTDKDGNEVPIMFTNYEITAPTGELAIVVYYSGKWTASFTSETDWAYIDREQGEGIKFLHLGYLRNDSGNNRSLILRIDADNGENLEITITQAAN